MEIHKDAWRIEKMHDGKRMMCTPAGLNMMSATCQHSKTGACAACYARWYVLADEVAKLLQAGKPKDALELLNHVQAIAKEEGGK